MNSPIHILNHCSLNLGREKGFFHIRVKAASKIEYLSFNSDTRSDPNEHFHEDCLDCLLVRRRPEHRLPQTTLASQCVVAQTESKKLEDVEVRLRSCKYPLDCALLNGGEREEDGIKNLQTTRIRDTSAHLAPGQPST